MENKFKPGDTVIAVTSNENSKYPRFAGEKYRVIGVMNCPDCRVEFVTVNKGSSSKNYTIKCGNCGCTSAHSNHVWTRAVHFELASEDTKKHLYVQLQNAIEKEDYELAAKLRDQINS